MANSSTEMTQGSGHAAAQQKPGRSAPESALPFPVDICERDDGITLVGDMPGVAKERLDVRVDGNNLLIEGSVHFDLPEQAQALYADVRSTLYRRSFALSRELQVDNIQASLEDGVLTIRIPKRAELRPRKIEVRGS